ncbi:hypothetical protein Y017_02410 [Alcanivorax sp. 97CO-5]|nr:hypothetical protein Y017_02410 [Alcanivorax sp. 97CO-5]
MMGSAFIAGLDSLSQYCRDMQMRLALLMLFAGLLINGLLMILSQSKMKGFLFFHKKILEKLKVFVISFMSIKKCRG